MIYNLYFFSYNNYYNRIVKREETVEEYGDWLAYTPSASFNPNDGVYAQTIVNGELLDVAPDYMVATDTTGAITSRWYVLEMKRTRAEQWEISLLRDVIADWRDEVLRAPAFVEKGFVNKDDPAIYNAEDFTPNQIKKAQYYISDKSETQWIVGYIPKNLPETGVDFRYAPESQHIAERFATFEDWAYNDELNREWIDDAASFDISAVWKLPDQTSSVAMFFELSKEEIARVPVDFNYFRPIDELERGLGYVKGTNPYFAPTASLSYQNELDMEEIITSFTNEADRDSCRVLFSALTNKAKSSTPSIASLENKYVKETSTGKIYRIVKRSYKADKTYTWNAAADIISEMNLFFRDITINTANGTASFTSFLTPDNTLRFRGEMYISYYTAEEVPTAIGATIPAPENRAKCYDSPYDIFCMPYSNSTSVHWQRPTTEGTETGTFISNKNVALAFVAELAEALGSSQIYDVQLLPFCPVPAVIGSDGSIDTTIWPTTLINAYRDDGTVTPVGSLIWCVQSSGSFRALPPNDEIFLLPQTSMEFKVANQCDMFRLCSPTDASAFEFSLTKNRGISHFNITYTYRPFQPYIHIAPEFAGLYGDSYEKEKRGLILRGDFSLSKVSSDWANYKASNSNYEAVFNRQIENMEVQNKYTRESEIWQAVAGGISGMGAGALSGSAIGGSGITGIIGGGVGAAAGAAFSAQAAYKDIQANEALREEALDYTSDLYKMNLQAIQARPLTLTNISAFDIDSSPFPILEYYSCSDIEKEALRNKMRYNGMSVMRIGALSEFSYNNNEPNSLTYIKGKLIRLVDIPEDYHIVNEIANQINKGVFI